MSDLISISREELKNIYRRLSDLEHECEVVRSQLIISPSNEILKRIKSYPIDCYHTSHIRCAVCGHEIELKEKDHAPD